MKGNEGACLEVVLAYEGGYSDDPRDPGGATMYGVTQRTYNAWLHAEGRADLPVHYIAMSDVEAIYRLNYWDTIGGDGLPPGVDLCAFDGAVNSGFRQSLRWLDASRRESAIETIRAYCDKRLSFMHAIKGGKLWRAFGKGWGRRVADVEARSIKMAGAPPVVIAQKAQESTKKSTATANAGHATSGAAASTSVGATHGLPLWFVGAIVLVVGGIAVVLYLKSRQHAQRAAALTGVANGK